MATLCKSKKKKKSSKQNQAELEEVATHVCKKCNRLACSKKKLCKPAKRK